MRFVFERRYSCIHACSQTLLSPRSLQNSMKWDEDRFGLEYDLDMYNIVAVKVV